MRPPTYRGTLSLIYAEQLGVFVTFAQRNCWLDTKLETVWNILIVYNTYCACSFSREGACYVQGLWGNKNKPPVRLGRVKRICGIHFTYCGLFIWFGWFQQVINGILLNTNYNTNKCRHKATKYSKTLIFNI